MKDCFGLHGHSAFGYVAKEESGVGRKPATSVGLTTDPFNSLQAGKTVDISRCASEINRLAFRLPHCLGRFAPCGPAHPALRLADYRLPPVIVLPLWILMPLVVLVLLVFVLLEVSYYTCLSIYVLFVLGILIVLYYMG